MIKFLRSLKLEMLKKLVKSRAVKKLKENDKKDVVNLDIFQGKVNEKH